MNSAMEDFHKKWFGKPMSDELRQRGQKTAKMTPDEYHEYLEGVLGEPIPGDKVDREDF